MKPVEIRTPSETYFQGSYATTPNAYRLNVLIASSDARQFVAWELRG